MVCLIVKKSDKVSSEIECLKISKVVFTMVGINKRFYLTTSKEIIEACYSMPISKKKEFGRKMRKATIKVTFNIEDGAVAMATVYHRITVLTYFSYLLCLFYVSIQSAVTSKRGTLNRCCLDFFLKCAQNDGYFTSSFL